MEIKFVTLGSNKEEAEEILLTALQDALSEAKHSADLEDFKKAVKKIIDGIRSKPGVKDISATQCCVLISIQCSSYESVLHILEFFSDSSFQQCIDNVVEELRFDLDEVFIMTAALTLESLYAIEASLRKYKNRIAISHLVFFSKGLAYLFYNYSRS